MSKSAFEKWQKRQTHLYLKSGNTKLLRNNKVWLAALRWALKQKTYSETCRDTLDGDKIRAEIEKAKAGK